MTEIFEEHFPYYLSLGMTSGEYWEGDPYLVKAYRRKNMLEIERRNQELWLQGLYIHEAFATVVSNIFAKKGTTPKKYRETPIRITPLTEQEKKLEEQKARQQLIAKLNAIEARWNKNNKAEGSD